MKYLHTEFLLKLPKERLVNLAETGIIYNGTEAACYQDCADGYVISYLSVNFYKIWLPLWNLLREHNLLANIRVLELGAGPGTATWSLVGFYRMLAEENPGVSFSIDFTIVEKEAAFKNVFETIQSEVVADLPQNFTVTMEIILYEEDAFDYLDLNEQQYSCNKVDVRICYGNVKNSLKIASGSFLLFSQSL